MPRWQRIVMGAGAGLYLTAMGFVVGVISERMRFDHQRAGALSRLEETNRKTRRYLMTLEQAATSSVLRTANR